MSRGYELRVEDKLSLRLEWRKLDFNLDMEDAFYFLEFIARGEPVTIQLGADGVMTVSANASSLVISGVWGSVRIFEDGEEYYMLKIKDSGEWTVEKDYCLDYFAEEIIKAATSRDYLAKTRIERLKEELELAKDLAARIEKMKPEIERRMPRLSRDLPETLHAYIQETAKTIEKIERQG
jgi:hypothetical protein